MGFISPKYTWMCGNLSKISDKAICNVKWDNFALDSLVRHLHKLKYDHCPILISIEDLNARKKGLFCFLVSWMSHPKFKRVDSLRVLWWVK